MLKAAWGKVFSKLQCFVIRFVNWCYTLKCCRALCFMQYPLKCLWVKGFVEYTINLDWQPIKILLSTLSAQPPLLYGMQ